MKKFTLLLLLMVFAGLTYAQQVKVEGVPAPVKGEIVQGINKITPDKAGGDVFWSTTFDWGTGEDTTSFDLPDGWEIVDNSDFGNPWMWRSPYDTLGGCCTWQAAPGHFETPMDGYITVPADEYNRRDGVGSSNPMDTYIMTPSIDCSDKSSVVVKFNHLWRACCSGGFTMTMAVTNDDGVHWAEYTCRYGLPNNRVLDDRFRRAEFNISDVAAGMSNVKIRFYWQGSSHYYWMIDDLRLTEAFENEIVLEDYWAEINGGFDERVGHINYMPLKQIGMESSSSELGGFIGDYELSGAFLNNGMTDQYGLQLEMTVVKNGQEYWQEASDAIELWSLDRDTLTANSVFLADDYGDYNIKFAAVSENEEEVPENDTKEIMFTVTDSLYHRADFSAEASSSTGGWVGGNNAGDMVGVFYDLYETSEINSITARLGGVSDDELPEMQFVLQKWMEDDEQYIEWIMSEIIPVDSTHERTWITLDMEKDGETEFLEPGLYIACVRGWGDDGSENGNMGLSVGWDKDNREGGYTYNYRFPDESWFNTSKMNLIGMVFNETGGPTEASVTFNVDMNAHIGSGEFNPDSDFVDVSGTFNGWGDSEPLTDEDGDGIYTITMDGFTVAGKIEYKYRINANWDTSEFPFGGPNRTYTVRYWDVLDNVYNNGETVGVENLAMIESINIYPNPNQGEFTVSIVNSEVSDMVISLMDIQGHVVYKTQVTGITHTEVFSEDLNKGVYFLSINNGKEVKVQKVLVQ